MILLTGIFIGMVKGQEARQKWVNKKKIKYEAKRAYSNNMSSSEHLQVMLDEIEMATYHSS
jgi:hypothetical protein